MKRKLEFNETKFRSLSEGKQKKIFLEFIRVIEQNWQNEVERKERLNEFGKCLQYSGNTRFFQTGNKIFRAAELRDFLSLAVPIERWSRKDMKDEDFIIRNKDGENTSQKKIPLYLILDNLRSSFNVGSIFRSAECFKISEILLCGYTATPENTKVSRTAMGTAQFVNWSHFDQTIRAVDFLKEKDIYIYALETVSKAVSLDQADLKKPCAVILGNEALGIAEDILRIVDKIVQIPIPGWKNSLNVGVAAGILCYEINRQWKIE